MKELQELREKVLERKERIPKHIAVIMDGNGRWAKKRFAPRTFGHRAGVKNVRNIVEESQEIGIQYLTLYAFSTENWKRPKQEVSFLMNLLVEFLKKELLELHENNVRIRSIGRISEIYEPAYKELLNAQEYTKENTGLNLVLAVNYSGRAELLDCIRSICENGIKSEDIDEGLISQNLYIGDMPEPDLIIRTSGELRLSNFLLWQSAYSEFYFTDLLWPDFSKSEYLKSVIDYQNRDRRFGGL